MICPQCSHEFKTDIAFGIVECPQCQHAFFPEIAITQESAPLSENNNVSEAPLSDFFSSIPDSSQEQVPEREPTKVIAVSPDLGEIAEFGNQKLESTGSGGLFYNIEISGIDSPELRQQLELALSDKKLEMQAQALFAKIKNGTLNLVQVHPVKAAVLVSRLKGSALKIKWNTGQMIRAIKLLIIIISVLFSGVKASADDWDKVESNLKGYAIKIGNIQDEIRIMIDKKNQLPKDASAQGSRAVMLDSIKKKYTELKQVHKDMMREMERVRFEYPEKGNNVERRYRHIKIKSMDELEGDTSLDGELSRLKKKSEQKYK